MLFYPSHDIALANGVRHFNPPVAALRLQEDLASLSDIWNEPFKSGSIPFPQPWGWDWDTRKFLHDSYKIKMSQLPTDEELTIIRDLSSRKTTITIIEQMKEAMTDTSYPTPEYLQNMAEVEAFVERQKDFVLKTPWSSSGRGLMRSVVPMATIRKHAAATIQKMGGILGEPWIEDKAQDFAMLFFAGSDEVKFIGYSLFDNDGTTYRQGYLLSNKAIEERIGIAPETLHKIRKNYERILTDLFQPLMHKPWQIGYVGIDMMTYRSGAKLCISPCVEMNLRCTMGVVCRLWHDKYQEDGIFRISPMEKDGHFKAQFLTHKES